MSKGVQAVDIEMAPTAMSSFKPPNTKLRWVVYLAIAVAGANFVAQFLVHDDDSSPMINPLMQHPLTVFPFFMAWAGASPWVQHKVLLPTGDGFIAQTMTSHLRSKLLYISAKLRIADLLSVHGPLTAQELAQHTGSKPAILHRMLRALASYGVFKEAPASDAGNRIWFANNHVSGYLKGDAPGSVRDLVLYFGSLSYWAAASGLEAVLSNQSTATSAFEEATGGTTMFDYLQRPENVEARERFDRAHVASLAPSNAALGVDFPWDRFANKTVADIGGGMGLLFVHTLQRVPSMRGVIFEMPNVAENAHAFWQANHPDLAPRLSFQAGDFFKAVPVAADAFYLQNILHDWTDEQCVVILGSVRAAMQASAAAGSADPVLLVGGMVIDERGAPWMQTTSDMEMLTMAGGVERTLPELQALLQAAGFRIRKRWPIRSPLVSHVIETVAA